MIFGVELNTFIIIAVVEVIIGFLIGFFILPKALKWAIVSFIVMGILVYFGLLTVNWDGVKDIFKSDSLKSLLILISLPLSVGMVIGFVVKKIFE